ncbi:MAG: hypothetical protein IJK24_08250 [Oscillospiraceae bacterium]|nr:hypothetical protein [Oscillospiraceae bacterium]
MRRVFAGDFGAGNTCLFYADPDAEVREASELNNPGGEPSGYIKKNGDILIGLGLFELTYEQLIDIESFHINIKAKPNNMNRNEMVSYFKAWREKIECDHSEEFEDIDEQYWFIGCPTGGEWKQKSTRDLYKSIFEEAGYQNVFIIPESNAAFAYYQKVKSIKDGTGSEKKYLLFDQGAYSLDATIFKDGSVSSYGGYLGASLIERMMIHTILESEEESIRIGKRIINLRETVRGACDLLNSENWKGKFYAYLLLKARILKERYFTSLSNGTLLKNIDTADQLDFTIDGDSLYLFVNPKMMEIILEKKPVKEILGREFSTLAPEVQENIGNKTWMQVFRDFLSDVDREYPEVHGGTNTVIMLTGGGSLMNCVVDAVKSHYKNAVVHCDKQALSAIGKGMAYWAPDKIEANNFEIAFNQFIEKEEIDDDGDSVNCVIQYLSKAFAECIIPSFQAVVKEEVSAVTDSIVKWRDYHCSNNEIPSEIEKHLKKWCNDTGIPKLKSEIEKKIDELKSILNKDFNSILDSFSIPREDILKKEDKVFLSETSLIIPELFNRIVEIISDYYKKNDIWEKFPNKRKGILSDPRADFCNAVAEQLTDWLDKTTDSTFDTCKNVFCKMEFEISDGVNWTINKLFVFEGYTDLVNLMKAHRNEILGQLVLEECIEDYDD